jgi:hypothetical protein
MPALCICMSAHNKNLLILSNQVAKIGAGNFKDDMVGPMGEQLSFEEGKEPTCDHCGRKILNYANVTVNGAPHIVGWNCWVKFRDMRTKAAVIARNAAVLS